jgi:hypothetical protein
MGSLNILTTLLQKRDVYVADMGDLVTTTKQQISDMYLGDHA